MDLNQVITMTPWFAIRWCKHPKYPFVEDFKEKARWCVHWSY